MYVVSHIDSFGICVKESRVLEWVGRGFRRVGDGDRDGDLRSTNGLGFL